MGLPLFDMHCHLDFQKDPVSFLEAAAPLGLSFLSCTVTPEGYLASRSWAAHPSVALGLGAHPWWVADGRIDDDALETLIALVPETPLVGEIGIDLSPRHADLSARGRQADIFRAICEAAAHAKDKVLSIHSVRSAGLVLDILEETGCLDPDASCTCIFHWFSGSVPELRRAIQAGCAFSVGEGFLATKRAKEYLKLIPRDRLMLETDYPPEHAELSPKDYEASLSSSLARISGLWQEDMDTAASRIAETSRAVFRKAKGRQSWPQSM